jgi:citrate synthase
MPGMTSDQEWVRTGIGASTAETISVCGRDLAGELMGNVSFTDLAFLLVRGRLPSGGEGRLLDAVLVSLADHGLTPTVLAARLTYTGAPESLQGAIASGLLGSGSVFLGVVEDTAAFLGRILDSLGAAPHTDQVLADAARAAVRSRLEDGQRVPGLGHPVHKREDPRTPRMYEIARETGQLGDHLRLLALVADAHREQTGKSLPVNGAGVAGAALADLGMPRALARGFAVLARTAGLLGHLAEEMEQPLGMSLYREIDERAVYEPRAEGTGHDD